MNIEEWIIDSLRSSTAQVFSTMLGMDAGQGTATIEHDTPEANDQVVSLIGLAGAWAGTGSLSCSPALACRLSAQMLMTEIEAVNEEVLDAMAELTNMIIGNVKTDLEQRIGPLGLSIPTVVYGRNFKTRSPGSTEWIVVRFCCEGENLLARMCLAQKEGPESALAQPATGSALSLA
jgi:chemotaxis protein CheX